MKCLSIVPLLLLFSFPLFGQTVPADHKVDNFVYFEPIFIHHDPNKPAYTYQRFEEISNIALDSVFILEKDKYRIKEKHDLALSADASKKLVSIFNALEQKEIEIGSSIEPLKLGEVNGRYAICFLVETESSLSDTTTAISEVRLKAIILDTVQNKIVFYRKSHSLSPKYNGGYAFTLIKNLNKIYKKINKL